MRKQNPVLQDLQEHGYIISCVSESDLIADRVIERSQLLDTIDGLTAVDGSWKIVVPKNTALHRDWGLEIENPTPIIGVLVKGKIRLCLKVEGEKIISTHFRYSPLPTSDFKLQRDVIYSLEKAGIFLKRD